MPELLLGIAVLVGLLILLRLFVTTSPSAIVRALRHIGTGVLALAGLTVAIVGRRVDLGLLLGSMAWGLYTNGHLWPHGWPIYGRRFGGAYSRGRSRGAPRSGQTSRVATSWIEIELQHDTGEMQGNVLQGAHKGRALSALSPDDLLGLYDESSTDPETARLLEAYMDRRLGPEWRERRQQKPDEESKPRGRRDSNMSREEAYRVLGLSSGASEDEIRAAHKKLMMQNHPDRGGSDYLASKINEAKDVLLG
jgi:hypothetical protein